MEPIMAMKNVFKQVAQEMIKNDQTLSLKENEIVIGKVTKLFLDQRAMIQIGQTKMVAQLETALNSLQNYWFVVKGTDETGGIQLKVLKEATGEKLTAVQQAKDLLSFMQIRPTKENMTLLTELMKQNVSFTKAELSAAFQLLKSIPKMDQEKAVQAILFALNKNLPMTESVIKSLTAAQSEEALNKNLQSLHNNLNLERSGANTVTDLKNKLLEILQKPLENYKEKIITALMKEMNNPKTAKQDVQTIVSLINKLAQPGQNQSSILNMLQEELVKMESAGQNNAQTATLTNKSSAQGIVNQPAQGEQIRLQAGVIQSNEQSPLLINKNLQQQVQNQAVGESQVKPQTSSSTAVQSSEQSQVLMNKNSQQAQIESALVQPSREQEAKAQVNINTGSQINAVSNKSNPLVQNQSVIVQSAGGNEVKSEATLASIPKEQAINERALPLTANQAVNNSSEQFTKGEITLLQRVISQIPIIETKQDVLQLFTALDEKLGQKEEISLLQQLSKEGFTKVEENLNGLKQMLIAAQKDVQIPAVREQIEQLILRLNGNTLLHQDNGPTQQIITQIPLNLGTHETDLTIQWNGQKRADGTIDPNYCRILFYLELLYLEEVMIDVHIQNRVLTISVLNNNEYLDGLVKMQTDSLKESLLEMNYQLSSIKVRPFTKEKDEEKVKLTRPQVYPKTNGYTGGVDITI
ncbi:hypothetical protein [Metabacillus fastidiosus]|uniref:hypothetical protein n=1 Tax=Metabacillus fastidiosus TaxID=1458 RepID=UPI003D2DA532